MKYAHVIETKILGWYDDSTHSKIPTPNIEVTDKVWQEAININANCYQDGKFIVKDLRTEEDLLQEKINEAKTYLLSTDYKMTIDYFATLTESEQLELTKLRTNAREFIRANK